MTTVTRPPAESSIRAASIVLLGADAVLAARPATPVQLAHACLAAGYSTVIPPSWGDELLAAETIRQLERREARPVVFCACPHVAERLLGVGDDLAPFLLPLVAPPVAAARYLRHLAGGAPLHITFVGRCPAGSDPSIDAHVSPEGLLSRLASRDIELLAQPLVFDAVLAPDRRRHRSLPGGVPAPEALWSETGGWPLVEIDGAEPLAEFAQHLATGEGTLLDLSPTLECTCSGAGAGIPARSARAAITSLEPPRSTSEVIDVHVLVQLTRSLPGTCAAGRNGVKREPVPVDVTTEPTPPLVERDATPMPVQQDASPAVVGENHDRPTAARRRSPPAGVRAVSATRGMARPEGRPLPRAYVARRRTARRSGSADTNAQTAVEHEQPHPSASAAPTQSASSAARAPETHSGQNGTSHPPVDPATRADHASSSPGRLFASVPIASTKRSSRDVEPTTEPGAEVSTPPATPPAPPVATTRNEEQTPREAAAVPKASAAPDLMSEMRNALDDVAGILGAVFGTVAGVVRDSVNKASADRPRDE